ncbi:Hypp980 [Branchiostoma lanceolatum]|uniref:Hypp980 protein n=1 Tax=Branchiostoma lanceolatum TaxID=7740 RepID=A0A8K0EII1_BRALA|nr:Hypp980 [Branchiostoma lanceolatum]
MGDRKSNPGSVGNGLSPLSRGCLRPCELETRRWASRSRSARLITQGSGGFQANAQMLGGNNVTRLEACEHRQTGDRCLFQFPHPLVQGVTLERRALDVFTPTLH